MYNTGQGVPKNYKEAVKWYQAAADKGNDLAKQNLARINNTDLQQNIKSMNDTARRIFGGITKLFS
jgi:TPR repeat protein